MVVQQHETFQHRVGELAHQPNAKALKLVLLNQLIEVHRQKLECDTDVIPERKVF